MHRRASGFTLIARSNKGARLGKEGSQPFLRPPCRSPTSGREATGFTLIELLVALAVFAVLSGLAYRSLAVVLDSRGHIDRENRKWREVALFFARLEQDVATALPRPVRDAGDAVAPAFAGTPVPARAHEGLLVLTRTAFATDPGAAEPPRRLGYRMRGSTVELLAWTVLDQGPRTEPAVVAALRDVRSMEVRFLDRRGQWHAHWPPAGAALAQKAVPAGIEVALTLTSGERVVRLLPTATRKPQL